MQPWPAVARDPRNLQIGGAPGTLEPGTGLRGSHHGRCCKARHVGPGRMEGGGTLGGGAVSRLAADGADFRSPTDRRTFGASIVRNAEAPHLQQMAALLIAGVILYVPANVLPVITMT